MKALLAAFEPFGGETINPSWEVARALSEAPPEGIEITATALPVAFGEDVRRAWPLWDGFEPDLFLGLGQSGGSTEIRIERFAHNLKSDRSKKNESAIEQTIVPSGPAAYVTTLPVSRLVSRLRQAGIPATVSRDAGEYLCNHLFYQALHRADSQEKPPQVGFVHLPYLPEQAARHSGNPSLSLEVMVAGVLLLLKTVIGDEAVKKPASLFRSAP